MRYLTAFATLLGLLLVACGSSSSSSPPKSAASGTSSSASSRSDSSSAAAEAGSLCGLRDSPPATYQHVFWLIQENKSAKQIIGSKDYSYLNQTLIQQCGLAKNYHSTSHPSLPNYLALTSGTTTGKADRSNCQPKECPQPQDNLFGQVERSGKEWRQYAEAAAGNCDSAKSDAYEPEHAVPVYFTTIAARCKQWDVPLGTPDGGALRSDIDKGSLPAFAFISPDGDHEAGQSGDQWLNDWISRITATADYKSGNTAIFVTWDEGAGDDESSGETCTDSSHEDTLKYPSCWVPLVVISPSTKPATTSSTFLTHYSLLATTEDLLGLSPHLGKAAGAPTLRSDFGL